MPVTTDADRMLPLRERKKLRTRQALAETALAMFTEHGYEATTLDALVDAVEVSKRTFFRNFRSKEDVALTPVKQLWDTYLAVLDERELKGPLLPALRDALLTAVDRMDEYWYRQFLPTLHLIRSTPALDGHSLRYCSDIQSDIVRRIDTHDDLELRLLVEIVISAWRCAITEWSNTDDPGELTALVERAFAAIPTSIALKQ